MIRRYHLKYFNEDTHRTDNATCDATVSPVEAAVEFMHEHPNARTVYQVFEQVPIQRSVRGPQFRVDVGNTARVVFAQNAAEAAQSVSSQLHKPVRRVWRLAVRHARVHGHDILLEAS